MTEQDQQQPDLSDLITRVVDALKTETAYVLQKAQTLEATADTSSAHEFQELAGQCDTLSQKAYASAAELTQGGVQDWVYSVKAYNEVASGPASPQSSRIGRAPRPTIRTAI